MATTQKSGISDYTIQAMRIVWSIWSEVGDLDRYPTLEEMATIFALASEVNGVRFHVGRAETLRRMEDNHFYPYEDHVAQDRAYMFAPGAWDALSYVDSQVVLARLVELPAERRLGVTDAAYENSNKDLSDPRGAAYAALTHREQNNIQNRLRAYLVKHTGE